MSEYTELKARIAELQKQAEEARRKEVSSVIAEIRAKMAEYDITVDDLAKSMTRAAGRGKRQVKGEIIYVNPETGKGWTGKGRKPKWLIEAMQKGVDINKFRVA